MIVKSRLLAPLVMATFDQTAFPAGLNFALITFLRAKLAAP